jgi:hypothetical protein
MEDTASWDEQARRSTDELAGEVRVRVDQVRSELESFDRQFRTFVRERPFVALFGAVAAGYVLGRLIAHK